MILCHQLVAGLVSRMLLGGVEEKSLQVLVRSLLSCFDVYLISQGTCTEWVCDSRLTESEENVSILYSEVNAVKETKEQEGGHLHSDGDRDHFSMEDSGSQIVRCLC